MKYRRTYIEVIAVHEPSGHIAPMAIKWGGLNYGIDKVTDVQQRVATKAEESGLRYTCVIEGKERYLFLMII